MIDFYRKVNKFFKKFAKCDPCKRTSKLITLFEPRPNNKTQKHHWTNAILEHTSIHHQRLPCGTKFLRVLIFAIFPAIRANKFPRIKIIVKKFFYAQFLASDKAVMLMACCCQLWSSVQYNFLSKNLHENTV